MFEDVGDFDRLAVPGERVVYWTGRLAIDCEPGEPLQTSARLARAWAAEQAEAGRVELVQRRVNDDAWDYIAVRRKGP